MLRKFSALAIIMALTSHAFSQDSDSTKKAFNLTGSIDAYYRYNFHNAEDLGDAGYNNLTSFTNSQNTFAIGMASLKADYTTGKVTAVADLGFGKRAQEFSYNDSSIMRIVKQAYVSYAPSDKVKFTFGKWATHVGYELVDAYLNRNYSMSYMFSKGPFFHTGLKADFTLGKVGIMVGVANQTDQTELSFGKKWILGQVSGGSDKVKAYLNYQGGKLMDETSVNQVDLVVTGTVSDKFSLGVNGTLQNIKADKQDGESWWGSALYLNFDPTKTFGLTLRGEYFDDEKGLTDVGSKVLAATLTGNIRIDNLTIMPEFRLDNAKDEIFVKNNLDGVKSSGTFLLAVVYHF
jgi:hypothetical protein